MGQKAVKAIVRWGSHERQICPLEEIDDKRIKNEIESSIVRKHLELWKMYVLVDPKLSDVEQCQVASDCKTIFGLPSAEERQVSITEEIPSYVLRLATQYDDNHPDQPPVTVKELRLVHSQCSTWSDKSQYLKYDLFCKSIEDIRKKPA